VAHHLPHQRTASVGDFEQEVAAVGRVVAAIEQTGDHQPVHRARRVRRVHAQPGRDSAQVECPTAGHHHQQS